jgi:tripartite-type tricarboxylate transporter receptor subunit TctC
MKILKSACVLLTAIFTFATQVQAQAFPTKPITLLIPYPPGGSADMLARPVAAELQKRLGQTVIIDYKPGAGGTIATGSLARAEPDGYTLLMVLAAHAINPSLYSKLPYNTKIDFAPVSLVATLPLLVTASSNTPVNTIPDLIQYAKANPGKLTFASAGSGNTSHLAGELFKSIAGVDILHVPYKGSGPAVTGLLSGEVSLMFDSISTSVPHVKSGKLKALAVTGEKRSPLLPLVPTVSQAGVPGFEINGWYGIIAPAKTPPQIVSRLSKQIADVVTAPAMKERLDTLGYAAVGSTPEEFARHIDAELIRWAPVVVKSGAKVE